MESNILTLFPIEIWENIILYCDGATLEVLSQVEDTFRRIIISLDIRRKIWKDRCFREILDEDRTDIRHKLQRSKSTAPVWSQIYRVWRKWKNLSKGAFEIVKLRKSFLDIADIKVSNEMIVVADKTGFSIVDSVSGLRKQYKIGPVKHLELMIRHRSRRPDGTRFVHDILDCTIGSFHRFFDLHCMIHLRCDSNENQIVRYSFGQKKLMFSPPILEANISDDLILYVTENNICQAVQPMQVVSELQYRWEGARSWYLWHAKLLFCAKDDTLDIYLNGRLRKYPFDGYPRMSAVFYFASMLFLGSIHGTLYVYRIEADDIFNFNFDKYECKVDLGCAAIVGIDLVENYSANSCIIAATDNHIYRLLPESFSKCFSS